MNEITKQQDSIFIMHM